MHMLMLPGCPGVTALFGPTLAQSWVWPTAARTLFEACCSGEELTGVCRGCAR